MADDSLGEMCREGAAKTPTPINLKGQKITVVPMEPDKYAQDLYKCTVLAQDGYLFHYTWFPPPPDFQTYKEWLKHWKEKKVVMFAIIDNITERAVGQCYYWRIDEQNRVIEVGGIIYSPELQRTVGATEAMYLLAKHAFDELGYRRYQWNCNTLNKRSWNAALRLGFTFEAVLRQNLIAKGHNRDSAFFSILDKEWPVVKQAMELWLSPDNFNDQGQQIQSLIAIRKNIQENISL